MYIQRLGQLDIKALYAVTTTDRQLRRLVLEYEKSLTERLPGCSAAVGYPVETYSTILDLGGVSLTNFHRVNDYVSAASSMGKFYIINAPWAFSAAMGDRDY